MERIKSSATTKTIVELTEGLKGSVFLAAGLGVWGGYPPATPFMNTGPKMKSNGFRRSAMIWGFLIKIHCGRKMLEILNKNSLLLKFFEWVHGPSRPPSGVALAYRLEQSNVANVSNTSILRRVRDIFETFETFDCSRREARGVAPEFYFSFGSNLTFSRNFGGKLDWDITDHFHIEQMAELAKISSNELSEYFGEKTGAWVAKIAKGIYAEPAIVRDLAKSVGCSKNFMGKAALATRQDVLFWLTQLSEEFLQKFKNKKW